MKYQDGPKRVFDLCCSIPAVIVLSPVLIAFTGIGAIAMKGNPFYTQPRPGKDEKIFKLIKFRTMSNAKDKNGNLMPDDQRLNSYGKFLRSTSIDELPELLNIIKGDMSLIGPRPLLVRDMVFMSDKQRQRHTVRPGLSGLAQVNGRNSITWEQKLEYDLEYLKNITISQDLSLIFQTIGKVFQRADINRDGTDSDMDFGDWLLINSSIKKDEYDKKMKEAVELLKRG